MILMIVKVLLTGYNICLYYMNKLSILIYFMNSITCLLAVSFVLEIGGWTQEYCILLWQFLYVRFEEVVCLTVSRSPQ